MGNMQFLKDNRFAFSGLLGVILVIPVFLLHFDTAVVLWTKTLHQGNSPYLFFDVLNPYVSFISNGATLIVASLALYIVGIYTDKKVLELGKSLLIGLISTGILVQILKHLIGRARPRLTETLLVVGPSLKSGYDSFPSGHTATAFCLAYILSRYCPRYTAVGYLFAAVVGFYRIDGLAHFPSDVLAGAVVGLAMARIVVIRMMRRQQAVTCRE